jgi:hypothetical protein
MCERRVDPVNNLLTPYGTREVLKKMRFYYLWICERRVGLSTHI